MSAPDVLYDEALLLFFDAARDVLAQIEYGLLSLRERPDEIDTVHARLRLPHPAVEDLCLQGLLAGAGHLHRFERRHTGARDKPLQRSRLDRRLGLRPIGGGQPSQQQSEQSDRQRRHARVFWGEHAVAALTPARPA
jgi:hypothetical protein